jgi:hypothetical protein
MVCARSIRRHAHRLQPVERTLKFVRLRQPTARDYRPGQSRLLKEWRSADGRYLITYRRVIYGVRITPHYSAQTLHEVAGRPRWIFCQGRPHRHRNFSTAQAACEAHAKRFLTAETQRTPRGPNA